MSDLGFTMTFTIIHGPVKPVVRSGSLALRLAIISEPPQIVSKSS